MFEKMCENDTLNFPTILQLIRYITLCASLCNFPFHIMNVADPANAFAAAHIKCNHTDTNVCAGFGMWSGVPPLDAAADDDVRCSFPICGGGYVQMVLH